MSALNRLFSRIRKGSGHHSWASRDYEDIDCQATGCCFNVNKKCAVPSHCKIGPNGGCLGFTARPLPKKPDGD